jgi:hypothetical protein
MTAIKNLTVSLLRFHFLTQRLSQYGFSLIKVIEPKPGKNNTTQKKINQRLFQQTSIPF